MGRGGRGTDCGPGVAGWRGALGAPAFRRWRCRVGRGAPRCSLFKRPAEAPRAWPALAAQTCRGWVHAFPSAAAAVGAGAERLRSPRPLVLPGAPAPSRSLPSPRLPRSPCLSLALQRALSLALIFSCCCCCCRGAAGRPDLGRLRSPLGSRSTPFPARSPRLDPAARSRVARSLRLGRRARRGRSRAG